MKFLFLLSLVLPTSLFAQNYQCVQPGVKRFYANDKGYLRGMRIDSVKTIGAATVLYPFRTPRGNYYTQKLDSTKGSWLGKTISILPNREHRFDNYWGDTVFIKTAANLNDTWTFYNDATNDYYTATLTAIDTMTVLGIKDSVKTIRLTSYNLSGVNYADSLNNAEIIFSKNYGFVQVPDLYMFPLHEPGLAYSDKMDYYTNAVNGQPSLHKSFNFRLIDFYNPDSLEFYNYHVGDVYEYTGIHHASNHQISFTSWWEVVDATKISNAETRVIINGWSESKNVPFQTGPYTSPIIDTFIITAGKLFDTTKMPEEWGQPYITHYFPNHDDGCITSHRYKTFETLIQPDGHVPTFEPCSVYEDKKIGIGRLYYDKCSDFSEEGNNRADLIYSKKNEIPCGTFIPLSIENKKTDDGIYVIPNPSSSDVVLSIAHRKEISTISITNTMGQVISFLQPLQKQTIDVSGLSSGIYIISIISKDGTAINKRIVVQH